MLHQTFSRASRLSQTGRRGLAHARTRRLPHRHTVPLQHTFAASFTTHTPLSARAQAATMANEQPQWAAAKVRQTFLDYFKDHGHTFGRHTP
jgi:hypothetical protein